MWTTEAQGHDLVYFFKTCANSLMVVFLPAEARVLGTPLAAHETKLHAQGKNSLEEAVDLANPVARAR